MAKDYIDVDRLQAETTLEEAAAKCGVRLDRAQAGIVFDAAANYVKASPKLKKHLAIAAMTGLRRGELASLAPKSFDWKQRLVIVEPAYTKESNLAKQPLTKAMIPDLRKWVAGKSGFLLPGLAEKRTRKMMERDLEAAGVPFKTKTGSRCFHCLRNTYISSLFDAGLSVDKVQRLARHSDVRLTMKYAKPMTDEAGAVDGLVYPGAPQKSTESKTKRGGSGQNGRKTQ